ncbi:hypothetical protein [Epilithonimonas lactis]|uniref:Uncharacterized protein n=1 Tax=Epilithonimonas lactis TaxID=421072 RepID=A0A085BLT6_9FLAO|nr:hypothetical protein [Epilithonimonas lactis]KFC23431.1 hypothetical protein IO89_02260 [Epilithonimonas lactis]SEQ12950.1 hypothetical protein SAMN04488097_1416 [Epilithonimonas lactis]
MENNDYLSPKIFRSIKSLWILLAIFIAVDFTTNFFYPENKSSFLATIFDFLSDALACLLFTWYFVINKRWRSLLIVLPLLVLCFFFMKDLRDTLDYYFPFEKLIDSDTLRKYTYLIVELAAVFVLSKRYLVEENIEGKWSLLKVFLLNLGFFSLYNTDMGMLEQMITSASYSSKTVEFIVTLIYYALSSIRSVAFLGAFLFLMACLSKRENIYNFSSVVLQFVNRYFGTAVLISISCLIFFFFYLLENAVSLELDFFGKKLTVFGWINNISVIVFFVICSRFVGQFLKERSILKQKYYGVVGSSVWIPVVNIISLLMIKFDDKIKFLSPANLGKAKKVHLIIASILILFNYKNDILDSNKRLEGLLFAAIYIAAFWIVAYIKKYNWIFPLILAGLVTMIKVYPFYSGIYDEEFMFKDYVLDFVKHTFSIAMILTTIVFYGIYYIAFQTLNKK